MKRYRLIESCYSSKDLHPIEKLFTPIRKKKIKHDWDNPRVATGGPVPEKIKKAIISLNSTYFYGEQFMYIVDALCNIPRYGKYFYESLMPKDLNRVNRSIEIPQKAANSVANLCAYFIACTTTLDRKPDQTEVSNCVYLANQFDFCKYIDKAYENTEHWFKNADDSMKDLDILYMGLVLAIMVIYYCGSHK